MTHFSCLIYVLAFKTTKEDNSTSSVLYLHYEDKMHELSHLIKLGSQYLTDSKRDIIYTEECIICCESLHENVALSYSK